ncbi:ATP-binding protein [Chloroflexota bacterium]
MEELERGKLEVGNLRNLLTILGEVQRDPRDALAEFVSNGRDALVELGETSGRVSVRLTKHDKQVGVVVSDDGIGMGLEKLRYVAHHICDSDKINQANLIGHKGIGLISFLQLSDECRILSRTSDGGEAYCLVLDKKTLPDYVIGLESSKDRITRGTDVYLPRVHSEVARVLTYAKLYEYLKSRYRSALLRREFAIQLVENTKGAFVQADQYQGTLFPTTVVHTKHGPIEIALYVWHSANRHRRVSLVGEGGATVYDDISEIDEFACLPWDSDQVEGEVRFAALRPSTSRQGVVRDSKRFPIFVSALKGLEQSLKDAIAQMTREHEEAISRQMVTHLRSIFQRLLRDLRDVDSPVRVAYRTTQGELGFGQVTDPLDRVPSGQKKRKRRKKGEGSLAAVDETKDGTVKRRYRPLPIVYPREFTDDKRHLRSELDREQKVIYINDCHPDYLAARQDGQMQFLYYLLLVTAKEYVVWNNPRADQVTIGEDLVRYLARARRYMPKRL